MRVFEVLICLVFAGLKLGLIESSSGEFVKRQESTEDYRLNHEKRLIDDLFRTYQVKFGRPVNNMSEQVVVYFGIYLIQIIDLVTHYCTSPRRFCLLFKTLHKLLFF